MVRKIINKQIKKKFDGCCYFCGEADYNLLDVHRILSGKDGGKYTEHNSIVTCVKCHRLIHSGKIVVDRKYFSTAGKWIVHYWENNEEKWQ